MKSELGIGGQDELIEAMGINRDSNTADFILMATPPRAALDGSAVGGERLELTVRGYSVELNSVTLDYTVSRPAFLQLSYSSYPYLQLYLDGVRQEYFTTAFGLIGLKSPAGAHRVELRPVLSPLRVAAFWLDGLGLAAIALLAAWSKLKSARQMRR